MESDSAGGGGPLLIAPTGRQTEGRVATISANSQKHPVEIYKELARVFDASSGTTAQKQAKAVDDIHQSPNGRRHGRLQLEECAAGITP